MKIVVTGGAGFIGSHLIDRLVGDNEVTAIDNLSSGKKSNVNRKAHFIFSDILNDSGDYLEGMDAVFHLAANPDVRVGKSDTHIHIEQNILATYQLLEAMRQYDITNIIFSSSSTVYGENDTLLRETHPCTPISTYGASKLACEALISSFCHTFGMRGWIFRLANIVGSRLSHGIIFDFIWKLKKNPNELEILGDGKQEKSYLFVKDCIDAMLYAFEHSKEDINIFNVGSEDAITIDEIARIVSEVMNLTPKFIYTGGRRGWIGDVPKFKLDITKIKNLGWMPHCNSRESIKKTIKLILRS